MNRPGSWSDEQLVTVFGDPGFDEHTSELMRRYRRAVSSRVKRRIGSPEGSEEAESDTWTRVLTGKNTFVPGGEGSLRCWLLRIADRAAIDWLRRRANAPLATGDVAVLTAQAGEEGPSNLVEEEECAERIHRAVCRLPGEEQMVLVLSRFGPSAEGIGLGRLTLQQVADLLGFAGPASVKQRLGKILSRLRKVLTK